MKNLQVLFFSLLLLIFYSCKDKNEDLTPQQPSPVPNPMHSTKAKYKITFRSLWDQAVHSTDFPSGTHFSPLIGMSHTDQVKLFDTETVATEGMKIMAETGATTTLESEIKTSISSGKANLVLKGGGLGSFPSETTLEIEVDAKFPLLSFVSMIAPSPDWFVAARDVKLYEDEKFVDKLELDMGVYDAGTDDGETFRSPNKVSNPKVNIHKITTAPLAKDGVVPPISKIIFEKL